MLNKELTALQEELNYHRNSIQELEERITEVKVYDGYAAQATEAVEDAIEQIGMGKYLWLFKEHILSMFPEELPTYLQDKVEEDIVAHEVEEIKPEKSYYELTGKPDLRPSTYEDLAPNISYSSDGRAYVGFNDKDEAEEFRDAISEPSLIDAAVVIHDFKYEVKFHCKREYAQEVADSVNSMSEEVEEVETTNFEEINSRVIYNHNDKTVYLGMTAKNRCDYYGQLLTGQLTVGEKYTYSSNPSFINSEEYKYELRITEINLEDAIHLSSFNLQRDPEHPDNAKLLTDWRANKVRELNLGKPRPKLIPLAEIKLGDIVYLNSIDNQYKVLSKVELDGIPHLEVINTWNPERPSLVSNISYLKECYLVPIDEIQIDPKFQDREEVLTETVNIYVFDVPTSQEISPEEKGKTTIKKSEQLGEENFPSYPYIEIALDRIEFGDIITSTPYSRSAYIVKEHKGEFVMAECLYHKSLPGRVGEEFSFTTPYLVEKAISVAA